MAPPTPIRRTDDLSLRTARRLLSVLGLLSAFLVLPLEAQTPATWALVPRVGLIQSARYWGRVPLNLSYDGVLARPDPGLQVGLGIRRSMGSSGWVMEGRVTQSLFMKARVRGECTSQTCLLVLVKGHLSVDVMAVSLAAATPSLQSFPLYAKGGLGLRRYHVAAKDEDDVSDLLRGSASEVRPMFTLGGGVQWRLAGRVVEVELSDMLSWAEFGFDARITHEVVLTLGIPMALR
jgi:hypothetical protein